MASKGGAPQSGSSHPLLDARLGRDPGPDGDEVACQDSGCYTLRTGDGGPVIPVVVRSMIATGRSGGTFSGGNGRGYTPSPSRSFAFDVPTGRDVLDLSLNITGDEHEAVYGFLVDPNGEPVSERTNQTLLDDERTSSFGRSLQFFHADPQPGRWTFAFAGDPLLASVQSPAPAATPLRLGSGASATVTLTITPTGTKGSVVKGYLYVDSRDPVTGSTDELVAAPYTYTIG